jgi:hypothetical protein
VTLFRKQYKRKIPEQRPGLIPVIVAPAADAAIIRPADYNFLLAAALGARIPHGLPQDIPLSFRNIVGRQPGAKLVEIHQQNP